MGRHIGLAHGIQQRGLAVIDMTHDGDDGRARLQHRRIVDVAFSPSSISKSLTRRRRWPNSLTINSAVSGIKALVDRRHDAHLHQRLD